MMERTIYSVALDRQDYDALMRVATEWSIRRADAFRLAIRALAEAVESQGAASALGPRPDDVPMVQTDVKGVGDRA